MRDVAQAAGVSPMTVSRAFKDDASVNEQTRRMVRETARRLGYLYDTTAQAFRAQRSGFVAVTLPSINNANFAATHRSLTKALKDTGLQILLGITGYSLEEEERLVSQLLTRRPEALVLTGGTHTENTRAMIGALDIPVLEIWDLPEAPLGHVVGFSNAASMELIVAHLAEKGHRKCAFLGADGDSDNRGAARRRGVIRAAQAFGLPEVEIIEAGPAPVSMSHGAAAVRDLGDRIREFDALVCVSDPVAFGAISECKRLGLDVPGDIAATGFGAFEVSRVAAPSITTVDVGADWLGVKSGALIAEFLEAASPEVQMVEREPVLVPGQST